MGHIPRNAALLLVVVLIAGCTRPTAEPGTSSDDHTPAPAVTTTPVVRQDLTTSNRLEGWLGYRDVAPLTAIRDGILTWMPEEGTLIRRGDVVVEIDGTATRILLGDRPAWRRLAVGVPDGPDIRQLNDNLAVLGYAERDDLPGERFAWRTREAVKNWQEELGLRRTGVVEFGDVIFLPTEVRLGSLDAQPGMWVGAGQILAYGTGTKQVITLDLDPASRGRMSEGSPVAVILPDNTQIEGVILTIGRVVSTSGTDGKPTVKVIIEPVQLDPGVQEGDAQGWGFEAAPVVVVVERVLAEQVLVVPVGALLASAEAGYAVERVTAGGTEMVAVQPGAFADGLVEITGDIGEGDEVVVPS